MKLNNRGQVLVLFVVMFPIIFFLVAFFIDSMMVNLEKNKLNNIGELAIKYIYENKDDPDVYSKTLLLIIDNDDDISAKDYNNTEDKINITLHKDVKSLFGQIVGIKKYDVTTKYEGVIDGTNITYTRK